MPLRILLTGASGFLGSALARYWTAAGHQLCLLARPASSTHRINDLLDQVMLARPANLSVVMETVRSFAPDVIVHTACSYGRAGESSLDILDANYQLGAALLQATLTCKNGQIVFLNTGTVLAPEVSLYALTKTQFSQWGMAHALQRPQKLQFIDIRLQQMYGAGDDRSKFTTHVIDACRLGEPRLALTRGEQRRDFIHINDVVHAYDVILSQHAELADCDTIDVGSGEAVRIRDFVEHVRRLTGGPTVLDFGAVPYRTAEAMLCLADTTRLRALGWVPQLDLDTGLRFTIAESSSTKGSI